MFFKGGLGSRDEAAAHGERGGAGGERFLKRGRGTKWSGASVPLEHLIERPECLAHGRQNTTQLPNVPRFAKTAAGIKTMAIHKHRSKQGRKIEVWRK